MTKNSEIQICFALLVASATSLGCGGSDDGANVAKRTLGGAVWGLTEGTIAIQTDDGVQQTISANGHYVLESSFAEGTAFHISVVSAPKPLQCVAFDGRGTSGADDISNIDINCYPTATLAVGNDHSCRILVNGELKCWGNNEFGMLGQGDTKARGSLALHMGTNLPPIDLALGTQQRRHQWFG